MPQLRQCELVEPGRFRWGDATVPTPSEGEVLVRPGAVGMCGTDYHAFDGTQNFFTYPRILGHEVGATVVSFGPGCEDSGLKVGDRVAVVPYWECGSCVACRWGKPNCCTSIKVIGVHINGAMQGHLCVPKSKLVKSDILSLEQLALVETLCIGAHAVFRASVRTGERALVIGAGPIGLGTAQFAQAAGCEVIVMDVNEQRLDFMRATLGVEKAIVVRPGAPEVVLAELQEACEGELPTTVFDATGNLHSMNGAFSFVAHGGKLVFVGHTKMSISFDNPLFHSREMTVLASRNALAEDFARVIKLIETAKIDVSPWVTHRCTLGSFEASFKLWKQANSGVIKGMVQLCEPCEEDETTGDTKRVPQTLVPSKGGGLVVQFGTGVFLRGHIDWMLQRSRDAGHWTGSVLGVKLTPHGKLPLAARPQYPLAVRGVKDGERVDEESTVSVVERWLNPHELQGWKELLASAKEPRVDLVVSNSTEAGIVYEETARPSETNGRCPDSFPAKLAAWLAVRYEATMMNGPSSGMPLERLTVLPLELIEEAGPKLQAIVLRHAADWALGDGFKEWLANAVEFRSTLVDRIVTKPAASDDPLLAVAEPYHLLVVEEPATEANGSSQKGEERDVDVGGGEMEKRLGLRAAGLNVVYTSELGRWRKRKVALLNGAHHTLVFLGMRLGLGNVLECVSHTLLGAFVRHVLNHEIEPTLGGDSKELRAYSSTVLERFSNPFLDHRLAAIALNSAAKVRVRLLPSIQAYCQEHGSLPPGLVLALAAFFAYDGPVLAGCETTPAYRTEVCGGVGGLEAKLSEAMATLQDKGAEAAIREVVG